MKIPQTYFEDEVREGFYIPCMMKCAWAAQLEILDDITKLCRKNNLSYFAVYGTLLGAVRHGGFIPWDDDMDICMTRPDYERFCALAEKELPEGYSVLEIHRETEWDEIFARVVNAKGIHFDKPFLEKFHGFPYVAGVDIFPLDYLAPDENELQFLISLMEPIQMCVNMLDDESVDKKELEEQVCSIEEMCKVKFNRTGSLKNELFKLFGRLCSLYGEAEADRIGMTPDWIRKPKMRWPKEYFTETVLLPYECAEISVPIAYYDILKGIFGEYMRISQDGGMHNYPFYKKQEKILYGEGNPYPKRYKFHIEDFGQKDSNVIDTLLQIKNRAVNNGRTRNTERKEVVFLPYKASAWNAFESVWREAQDDPDCDVYVIPIPYYDKNWDGTEKEMHYEGDAFPDYVPVTRYDQFDFEDRHPDMIYFQFPHDEYHYTISVASAFYARNLINYTDRLIYIPYFVVDEIESWNEKALENAKAFINVPGVFYADKVIVQSENMRQIYIDTLTEFAGEETKAIWKDKIVGSGSPITDWILSDKKAGFSIPSEWQEMIRRPDGSAKKVILYHNSVSTLLQYQERMIEKLEDTFRIFKDKQEDVVLLWRPNRLIQASISRIYPKLWERYQEIVCKFREENWGIYDETADSSLAVAVCDAYYGDADYEMNLCRRERKPVMWQNVSIINGEG